MNVGSEDIAHSLQQQKTFSLVRKEWVSPGHEPGPGAEESCTWAVGSSGSPGGLQTSGDTHDTSKAVQSVSGLEPGFASSPPPCAHPGTGRPSLCTNNAQPRTSSCSGTSAPRSAWPRPASSSPNGSESHSRAAPAPHCLLAHSIPAEKSLLRPGQLTHLSTAVAQV